MSCNRNSCMSCNRNCSMNSYRNCSRYFSGSSLPPAAPSLPVQPQARHPGHQAGDLAGLGCGHSNQVASAGHPGYARVQRSAF